jgi:hypothetical protein
MRLLYFIPTIVAAALVLYVNGAPGGFAIWNLLPIGLGAFALGVAQRKEGALSSVFKYFAVVTTVIPILVHLAWIFDWGATATGSSTSALLFVFLPVWTIALGLIVAGLRWLVARVVEGTRKQEGA